MYQFIVYDKITGKINSRGNCSGEGDTRIQGNKLNEESMEGFVEDEDFYKVKDKKIVRKSEAEIKTIKDERKAKKKRVVSIEELPANITQGQLQDILDRISTLESEV